MANAVFGKLNYILQLKGEDLWHMTSSQKTINQVKNNLEKHQSIKSSGKQAQLKWKWENVI